MNYKFRSIMTRAVQVNVGFSFLLGAFLLLGAQNSFADAEETTPQTAGPFPPQDLVEWANPSQSAIIRHEITASIDPASGRLEATDEMTVVHPSGGAGSDPIPFLLWHDLTVAELSATRADGEAFAVSWAARKRLRARSFWKRPPYESLVDFESARHHEIRLPDGATWPDTLLISVSYSGSVVDSLHPPRAAYARSFDTTSGLILPEGAFLAWGSFWIPTRPDDIFTFELQTRVPQDWLSVSQGVSQRSEDVDGYRMQTWDCPHPMPEVYFVAGPYQEHHLVHGDVLAQTFTYADTDSSIYNRYLRGTGAYFDLYEREIGPYPFQKFALVENFWQSGYGMPSFTLLGDRVIRLPFILDTSYGHEILHNWWGNGVFVDVESGNWCEGLTTYGGDYRYQVEKSAKDAKNYRWNSLKNYHDYVSEAEDAPLASFRERHNASSQAIGYSKSMMVVHQVRQRVGEDAFREGLQKFYRDHLWRRASWTDLFSSFASLEESAEDWNEQWIKRTGAPLLAIESADWAEGDGSKEGEEWTVSVHLSQDADPPFRLDVPIRASAVAVPDFETRAFAMTQSSETFSWSLPFRPETIDVDPEFHVLRRLHREEIPTSLSQVLGADTTWVVMADPSTVGDDAAKAYSELFTSWNTTGTFISMTEADLPADGSLRHPTWYLGMGKAAASRIQGSAAGGENFVADDSYDWFATGTGQDQTWAVLSARTDQIATVGRKVPHYGKYSYVAFVDGTAKERGVWPTGASPMRVVLSSQTIDEKGKK